MNKKDAATEMDEGSIGTIHILRKQVLGLFLTHPSTHYVSMIFVLIFFGLNNPVKKCQFLVRNRVLLRLEFQVAHPILNVTLATDQK